MADVSDKGMSAALYMALTRSLIRAEARRRSSPRQALLSTHRFLLEISQADMVVTVFLRGARPGADECRFLAAAGMALGIVEKVSLEEVRVDLRPGDLLVLYTDGITDANSPAGEFFGVERLRPAQVLLRAGGQPQSVTQGMTSPFSGSWPSSSWRACRSHRWTNRWASTRAGRESSGSGSSGRSRSTIALPT